MPTHADLGAALRRLCLDRKRTIEDLAFAAEIHPTYLSGIERGVRNPTWAKLCALSKALEAGGGMRAPRRNNAGMIRSRAGAYPPPGRRAAQ